MKQGYFTVIDKKELAEGLWRMALEGDTSAITAPGQFLDIKLEGAFLRRPISICDWDESSVTIIFKVLGKGTERMSQLPVGAVLDILTGLGNGYDITKSGDRPLLVGGGVGIPPLYRLAKDLLGSGARPMVVLGFARAQDMFYVDEFQALGAEVLVCTEDGSCGIQGYVTAGAQEAGPYTCVYACGPTAMLQALDKVVTGPGQYSLEERMGCGFGACMGCSIPTKTGYKRVCKDGPVLEREEILWQR